MRFNNNKISLLFSYPESLKYIKHKFPIQEIFLLFQLSHANLASLKIIRFDTIFSKENKEP